MIASNFCADVNGGGVRGKVAGWNSIDGTKVEGGDVVGYCGEN